MLPPSFCIELEIDAAFRANRNSVALDDAVAVRSVLEDVEVAVGVKYHAAS